MMRRGVGTLVTSHDSECLGKDLKFYKTENEIYITQPGDGYWCIRVYNHKLKYKNERVTYLSNEAMLLTSDGWQPVNKLHDKLNSNIYGNHMIWGLKYRCVICNTLYFPVRPIQSICSMECGRHALKNRVLNFKPLHEKSIPNVVVEDWLTITSLSPVQVPPGVEAVRVTKVEGSDSIFINNLLLSSQTLQSAL